jgi:hypothetical protein
VSPGRWSVKSSLELAVAPTGSLQKKHPGRPKKLLDTRKLAEIQVVAPESTEQALEQALIFDARCMDADKRRELRRILPSLIHLQRAWKAEFMEYGCLSCHKKRVAYTAGGLCDSCAQRIGARLRLRFRRLTVGHDTERDVAALTNRFDAAQRLLNGGK